ncbi:MAG: helical backbone metal receptor [Gemmatimonadota bacterium]
MVGRRTARRSRASAVAAVLLFAFGCTGDAAPSGDTAPSSTAAGSQQVTDQAGRAHDFAEPAQRIVSLVPSATATLQALGVGHLLVGRTDFDDAAWLADVPSVGGGLEPNMEVLLSLQPDLVIRFHGEQDPTTPARLDDLGINHLGIRPVALADVYETNRLIGAATDRMSEAAALSDSIRTGLEALERAASAQPPTRFAYVLGGTPPWVSGPGTFVSELIELLGGTNAFADMDVPWGSVSREEFRVREIDVLVAGSANTLPDDLVPGARVAEIGDALDQPGPDIVEGATRVFHAIHPDSPR